MSNPSHPESRTIETSVLISAPLSTVHAVLLDFASYPSWSSFITFIQPVEKKEAIEIGDKLNVTIHPPSGSAMALIPTIVHKDEKGFGWQGHLANISGLFDGKHLFLLEEQETEEGKKETRLVHREEFGGVLYTPLMSWLGLGAKTRNGFEAFNIALKTKAEQVAAEAKQTEESSGSRMASHIG